MEQLQNSITKNELLVTLFEHPSIALKFLLLLNLLDIKNQKK